MTAQQNTPRPGERSFGDAARNFQQAAEQLAASAAGEASERAAAFLDEAAARLWQEAGGSQSSSQPESSGGRASRKARRQRRRSRYQYRYDYDHEGARDAPEGAAFEQAAEERRGDRQGYRRRQDFRPMARRSRRLYLNPARRRIVGVCAGIADYFGVEPWVTRCAALTALIFVPGVTFPAYWVAFVVMDRPPERSGAGAGREPRMEAKAADIAAPDERDEEAGRSPRRRLRHLLADVAELELRLRRMEKHITSGQYELQRELRTIEDN